MPLMSEAILTRRQTFNTVAQHDSHIGVRIGEATQVDSAAMKTISVLGLVFLPATFVGVRSSPPRVGAVSDLPFSLGNLQHELLQLFTRDRHGTRALEDLREVLDLLGGGDPGDCGNRVLLGILAACVRGQS
jgi:hypothetical protein